MAEDGRGAPPPTRSLQVHQACTIFQSIWSGALTQSNPAFDAARSKEGRERGEGGRSPQMSAWLNARVETVALDAQRRSDATRLSAVPCSMTYLINLRRDGAARLGSVIPAGLIYNDRLLRIGDAK